MIQTGWYVIILKVAIVYICIYFKRRMKFYKLYLMDLLNYEFMQLYKTQFAHKRKNSVEKPRNFVIY